MYKWTYTGGRPKARRRSVTVGHVVLLGLLLLTTSVRGQTKGDITNKPPPPSTPSAPIGVPTEPLGFPSSRPNSSGVPPSSVVEIKSSLVELKENVELMATIDVELLGVIASPSPNYATIVTDASDIRRLAVRLLRNLALPRTQKQAAPEKPNAAASAQQLKTSINTLDSAIQSFLKSPVLTQPHTVDAKLLSDAGADLEMIVNRSAGIQEHAAALAKGLKTSGKSTSARSRLRAKTSIQLTLECDAWSVGELLARPSEVKGHGSVNLGFDVQTKNHRLAEQLALPIEDCVDGEADEEATAGNMQYVAIARDFTSYEMKGRVFAYQVGYEIGLAKNGEITKRLRQPVWFYYVDEAGDGTFELLRSSTRTGLVPDWVKDLARKR